MRETKQAPATPEARAAMHEMMAAFEAFKGANDARLDEIERKASADTLLEEKVARIDQAVATARYAAVDVATDSPSGVGGDVLIAVSQWGERFGWGVEASAALD